jgi:hypothetical protein
VLVTGLCIGAHLLTGYLALLVIGVWVLVKPSKLLRRIGRAAVVGAGSLATAAWILVPVVADAKWTTQDPFSHGNPAYDSFGAPKVLSWLVTGALFDNKRWPIVSVLAGVGLLVCVVRFRKDERARVLIGAFLVSLALFFGRPTLGGVLKFLPGNGDLFLRRYVFGVHLAGILMAGVGAAWLGAAALRLVGRVRVPRNERWRPVVAASVVAVVGVGLLVPAFANRADYAAHQFSWVAQQRTAERGDGADFRALVAKAESLGPGRIFAGQGASWGHGYLVGFVPLDIELLYSLTDSIGFNRPTWSLSSSVLHYFESGNPDEYRLFDVHYVIEAADAEPLVPSTKVMVRGRFALYRLPDPNGYFEVVDAISPVTADRTNLGVRMQGFVKSPLIGERRYPTVAFAGTAAAPATVRPGDTQSGSPGRVLSEVPDPEDGRFQATVSVNRRAMLVLKESFDPRWRVTIDGHDADPQMVAPSFVGRELDPGRHVVVMQYVPYPAYWLLFLVSIGTVVVLWALERGVRRSRRRSPGQAPAAGLPVSDRAPADQPPASTAAPTAPE